MRESVCVCVCWGEGKGKEEGEGEKEERRTRQPSGSSSSSSGHGPPPSRDPSAGSSSIWIEFLPSGAVSVVEAAQDGFPSLSSPNWLGKQRASVFLKQHMRSQR